MGFGSLTSNGLVPSPTATSQNRIAPTDITVPALSLTGTNVFQNSLIDNYIAGDTQPRMRYNQSGLTAGPGGSTAPSVGLLYNNAPSGAVAGTTGSFTHKGVRIADLGWRNVKHYGATGNGSTNDTAAIQGCINAGAGVVYFPPGTYALLTKLFLPSGVLLKGAGAHQSVIFALDAAGNMGSMIVNTNNGTATGSIGISSGGIEDMTIDGNYAGRGGKEAFSNNHCIFLRGSQTSHCADMVFRRLLIKNSMTMAIAMQNIVDSEISSCHIVDCGRDGVSFWGDTIGCRIFGNLIEICGDDGIAFNSQWDDASGAKVVAETRDNTVANNVIGPGTAPGGSGIALSGADRTTVTGNTIFSYAVGIRSLTSKESTAATMEFNTIVGNTVMFSGGDASQAATLKPTNGIAILIGTGDVFTFDDVGDPGVHSNSHGYVIANNSIWGSRNIGIWLCQSSNGGSITDTIIQGNYIQGSGGSPVADACGILVGGATGTRFNSTNNFVGAGSTTDIQVLDNTVVSSARYGIRLHGVTRPMVKGNTVLNSGQQTASPGISLNGCPDSMVVGNRSRNRSGSGQTYGIEFISSSGTSMCTNNMVVGNATGAILNTTPGGTLAIWENLPTASSVANTPT